MPNMQQLTAAQASPEVPINENFVSLEHQAVYAKNPDTTTGLTWGYLGGRWGGTSIAAGTVTLTDAATNYVVAHRETGAVSVATTTTNWDDASLYARLYQLTTAGGLVTAEQDHRAGPRGAHGQLPPLRAQTVASAATISVPSPLCEVLTITGTTGITGITATSMSGKRVTLVFADALTVTDGGNLKLAGNFTSTADDTLTVVCDGTNWFEVARSVN